MPPACRNHRVPIAGATPTPTAASSLERPAANNAQNWRRSPAAPPRGGLGTATVLVLTDPDAAFEAP